MAGWARLWNALRGERLSREIDEELQSHLAEAVERGREPAEARRAFGSALRLGEESRGFRAAAWLDALRADAVFGWRQLRKRKATSAAAILSLGLAIGACTAAFRLIDALLLRPLPVANPERLFSLSRRGTGIDGKPSSYDSWAYPAFELMRDAAKGQADLIAVAPAERYDLTYRSDEEMEKAQVEYVSGSMFGVLGLRPAAGRVLTANDDVKAGAHPYAVITYDYWTRRFGRDASVVGRRFRLGSAAQFASADSVVDSYEIVGVVDRPFTGIEPGLVSDIFLPAAMHPGARRDDWTWLRTLAMLHPGVAAEPLRARSDAISRAFELERAKRAGSRTAITALILAEAVEMAPAAAGVSDLQSEYRRALGALGALVGLVLLIACANVANLMTAQAASRAREMALRISIGAGRWRMAQLALVESAMLAALAAAVGAALAWWSAPFVVSRINPADNPARLDLPADWRVLGFGVALTLVVTCLFGIAPALRASRTRPMITLRGGGEPRSRWRVMYGLIALQAAFCFVVLFGAGLFVATFDKLAHRPIGFSTERLLTVEAVSQRPQSPVLWEQAAEALRAMPGVEAVALARWPLLGRGASWNGFVAVNGGPQSSILTFYFGVGPGWLDTMKIPFVRGRDFRPEETTPGAAVVNETFVKEFFAGVNPLGKWFARGGGRYEIVGVVHDAPYRSLREAIPPVAYLPLRQVDAAGAFRPMRDGTFLVRTASENPMALASALRRAVPRARPEFRVSDVRTEAELVLAQTMRERLLAMLALFFAVVALLLAGVGLYGVLDYSVAQRQREIGIRVAIGAGAGDIARRVTAGAFAMVLAGAAVGLALGMMSVRYIETLLYGVKGTETGMLALPTVTMAAAALLAAIPAVIRAVRIDPVRMLRSE